MRTLTGEDAFFLYIETPDQHQHVVSTMILDLSTAGEDFAIDALIAEYEAEMQARPEFSQKLVKTPWSMTPPVLVEDPDFIVKNHTHHIAVPAPGTRHQLAAIVADIASTALSHRRPLWECWFISGLEGGRLAIVFKSHHCLFDGVHGARVLTQMFETDAAIAHHEHGPQPSRRWRSRSLLEVTYGALRDQWRYKPTYLGVFSRTVRSVSHRRRVFSRSRRRARLVPAFFETAPKLKINAPITPNRTVGMGSLSLADVKAIKNRLGMTVNDVVVAACTLALRNYLIATDDLPDRPLICYQPVSLALKGQGSKKADVGNEVGTMAVKLPVQIGDAAELLRAVSESTAAAKVVFDESFENLLQSYIGVVPPALADWGLKQYLSRQVIRYAPTATNVVISNIPGPSVPLYVDGARLAACYAMGPIISGQGPNITFMSYLDEIHYCVQACREHVPDIGLLTDGIAQAVAVFKELAQVGSELPPGPGA